MSGFLPDDIVVDILSRLPVKSLSRFRCVCKPWFKLFSNPNFVKMHHNHGVEKEKCSLMLIDNDLMYSSIDYYDSSITSYEAVEIHYPFKSKENGGVHIRGACNGLLCIDPPSSRDLICIWNPSTKEYKKIPGPHDEFPSHLGVDHGCIAYGFGYDCNNDNYKVVRIMAFYAYDNNDLRVCYGCEVKVYTLGSNSWKNIPFIYPYEIWFGGVLVNGALHWTATPLIGGSEASKVIVSFDLGDEMGFTDVSPLVHLDDDLFIKVGALGGCLCIFGESYSVGFVVWVMKDYGVRESWTKLFTIANHSVLGTFYELTPIRSFKNGEILLNMRSENPNYGFGYNFSFVLYDPKRERVRTLEIRGGNESDVAETYVESLVSLNTGTYVGQELVDETIERMKKLKLRKRKNKKNKKKLIYATVLFEKSSQDCIPTVIMSNESEKVKK